MLEQRTDPRNKVHGGPGRARPALVGHGERGNRCGHDPRRPDFDLRWEPPPNLPPFILEAADKVREVVYYQRWQFYEMNEAKRSERLEAIVKVLLVLIYRTDLVSGRVGSPPRPGDEWFRGITAEYIHLWTGMRLGRVTRAIADLVDHGFITSKQPCELDEETGEYTGLAAVRNITMKLWTRLRLKDKFTHAQHQACVRKRMAKFQVKENTARVRRNKKALAAKTAKLAWKKTPRAPDAEDRYHLRRNQVLWQLREQHPDWTSEQLYAAVALLVPREP